MEELQRELANVEQQIADEKAKGAARDNELIAELETKQADILLKMDEAAKHAEVQTAVATTQNDTVEGLTKIDMGDGTTVSIYDFVTSPEAGEFLIGYILQKVGEVTEKATIQAQSYQQEMIAKDDKIAAFERENKLLQDQNDKLGLENADLLAKRDAAALQIDELQEENKRISKELTDLRESVVKPAVSNMGGNLKELAEKAKAARPKIYNLHWKDEHNRKTYVANKAENGEEIEFGFLELGKYNVITEEEALQFRNSQPSSDEPVQAEPVAETPVHDTPLDNSIEPPALPSEVEVSGEDNTVGGDTAVSEVVEEARSVEERLARLEEAVFGKVGGKEGAAA